MQAEFNIKQLPLLCESVPQVEKTSCSLAQWDTFPFSSQYLLICELMFPRQTVASLLSFLLSVLPHPNLAAVV